MPAGFEQAPRVETERLILRAHVREDFEAQARMWADPRVVRFIGGNPSTRQQSWMRLLAYRGHWPLMGFGYWAVEEKQSGRFAGELGFADFNREIEPAMKNVPELGWALAPEFHGKGYASEAVRAAVEWGDAHLNVQRTVCLIDVENAASIRVAEKSGFREFERGLIAQHPTIFFQRHRGEAR